jgi:uncharacterized protein (TIGR03083 family)
MELSTDQLLQAAFDIARADEAELPAGLEERVLERARSSRLGSVHRSWSVPRAGRPSSLQAFIVTASELADLLDSLTGPEWARPTRAGGATVREIVEHLVGVERYVLGQLGRRDPLDAPLREDHWPVTTAASLDLFDEPNEVVAKTWWSEVLNVVAACGELGPDDGVTYHHLAGAVRGLLVIRTFELWTHADDIRQAVGRPLSLLDEDRLGVMVDELVRVLPFGLALSGQARPGRTARLALVGPGGGTFDVPLAPGTALGDPDVTLTANVIDLCRLAANRLAPAEFEVAVLGDRSLLEPLLVGATAFAAD